MATASSESTVSTSASTSWTSMPSDRSTLLMDDAELSGIDWLAKTAEVVRARILDSDGDERSDIGTARREGEREGRAEGARDGERDMTVGLKLVIAIWRDFLFRLLPSNPSLNSRERLLSHFS